NRNRTSATCSIASKTCLGKTYPALEVRGARLKPRVPLGARMEREVLAERDIDLVLALIDDFHPTAVEQRDGAARVFFTSAAERDAARDALETRYRVEQ